MTCVVVCSRGRPNVPLCQEDGTWTDIPRCIEHDPGVEEQIPGLCPGIPGYCSSGYLGNPCKFNCPVGPDIDSVCSQDGTWVPYPTCAGDIRDTQDGCDGCPGGFGGKRNRTEERILGIEPKKNRPSGFKTGDERKVRPSFAGNPIQIGPIGNTNSPLTSPVLTKKLENTLDRIEDAFKSLPDRPRSASIEAGLRNTIQQQRPQATSRPRTTQAPRTLPPPRPVAQPPHSRPQTTRPQQPQQPTQNQFSRPQNFQQQPPRRTQQSQFPRTQQTQFPNFSGFGNQQPGVQQGQQQGQQQQTQLGRGQQTQQQFSQQPRRGGFTSQQLDIIRNGVTRLNGFGGQQQQPQQNTIQQSQPRRINQQSSRTQTIQQPQRPQTPVRTTSRPVQTPPRPTARPAPRPTSRPAPRPTSRPQTIVPTARPSQPRPTIRTNVQSISNQNRPKPVPAVSGPAQKPVQQTTQLTDLQRAILKNAGVTNIPKSIPKVERVDPSNPRVVQFLVPDSPPPRPQGVTLDEGAFFGPFDTINLAQQGFGGPGPDLRAFPAIPGVNVPIEEEASFGPFATVDL